MIWYMCLSFIQTMLLHIEYDVFIGDVMCDHDVLFVGWICVGEDIERNEIHFNNVIQQYVAISF